jgi:hypothetical protein
MVVGGGKQGTDQGVDILHFCIHRRVVVLPLERQEAREARGRIERLIEDERGGGGKGGGGREGGRVLA